MSYLTVTQQNAGDKDIYVSFNYPPGTFEYETAFPTKIVRIIVMSTTRTKEQISNQIITGPPVGYVKFNPDTDRFLQSNETFNINNGPVTNYLIEAPAGLFAAEPNVFVGIVDESRTYTVNGTTIQNVGGIDFPNIFTPNDITAQIAFNGFSGNTNPPYTWRQDYATNSFISYTPALPEPPLPSAAGSYSTPTSIYSITVNYNASKIVNRPFTIFAYAYDAEAAVLIPQFAAIKATGSTPGQTSVDAQGSYQVDIHGLSPSTEYRFRSRFQDALGYYSPFSGYSSNTRTTLAAPVNFSKYPTNVTLEFIDDSKTWLGFRVKWDTPEYVAANIERYGTGNPELVSVVQYQVLLRQADGTALGAFADTQISDDPSGTYQLIGNNWPTTLLNQGDYFAYVSAGGYTDDTSGYGTGVSNTLRLTANDAPPPPAPTEVLTQWVDPTGFQATFVKDTSTDGIIQLVISRVKYSVDNVLFDAEYYEIGGTYEVLGTTYDMRIVTVYSRNIAGTDSFVFTYGANPVDETPIEPIYTYNFVVNAYAPDSVTALPRLPIVNAPVAASSTSTTPAVLATLNDYFTLVAQQITFPKSLAVTWQVPQSNGSNIDKFRVQVTSAAGSGGLNFTHEISNVTIPGTTYLLTVMDNRDFKLLTGGGPVLGNSGLYATYPTFDPRMVTLINLPQYYTPDVGVPVGTYTVKVFALSSTGAFNASDSPSASLSSRAPRLPAPLGSPNIYQTGPETLTLDGWGLGVTGATGPGAFIDTPRWYNLICKVQSGSTGPQLRRRFSYTDAVSEVTTEVVTGLDATKTYTFHTFFELVGVSGQQGINLPAPISFAVPELTSVPKETVTTVVLPPDTVAETAPVVVLFENVSAPTSGNTAQTASYEVVATDASTGAVLATETVLVSDITGGELLAQKSFSETLIDAGAKPEDIPEVPATIAQNITANPETPLGMGSVVFTALPVATTVTFTVQAKSAGGTNTSLLRAAPAAFIDDLPIPPPPPPCFVTGTQILTDEGYKAVETLVPGEDLVMTSDGRAVTFKLYSRTVTNANTDSAPYRILAGAFGPNSPPQDICLSGMHAIQSSDGVWQVPEFIAKKNSMVQQYDLGKTVTYYHIECSNFFNDNLVAQGAVVESFRNRQAGNERVLYKFVAELDGFIRVQEDEVIPVELEKMAVSVM
jgi:hypothetical protein